MEYYFNELDDNKFQRLINCILNARYGEDARITPLRGQDGGRDAETAPNNPYFEYQVAQVEPPVPGISPPRQGRHLFQVKHHRTTDIRPSDARQAVLSDFAKELKKNVLSRVGEERVNYFFLITNVSSSREILAKLDRKRSQLLHNIGNLHADIWWQEQIVAFLDRMPYLWTSFPEMFAGGKVPFIAEVAAQENKSLPRAVRIAINKQYERDSKVKFRQINLESDLSKLFIDLDIDITNLEVEEKEKLRMLELERQNVLEKIQIKPKDKAEENTKTYLYYSFVIDQRQRSAIEFLLSENEVYNKNKDFRDISKKIILEGSPGQGKSTITQMAVQIYRDQILGKKSLQPEDRWTPPTKFRLPFRIELRKFADWLNKNYEHNSVEEYLSFLIKQDSGGVEVTTNDIHTMVEGSPIILVFDGLDEVGSDVLRDEVLTKILDCTNRFENDLSCDLRVVITTRPPAISGKRDRLVDFIRLQIASMNDTRIDKYLTRWLLVQLPRDEDEQIRVRESFERRKDENLVKPLIKNPMQLSVLLHFIRLKGDAFPDKRAELYKEYFQIVIDRDVEKSSDLREKRRTIEALHQFLAYKIHALIEDQKTDGTLKRAELLEMVRSWLKATGNDTERPDEIFKIGEDRLGLIVILSGEGEEARYGYEVQPIREYFTAAYIDEQVKGDANNIFAAMIPRRYWREVALFLAGLRRPNEKADLLIRAKNLDNDEELGWRQYGRTIVLQLLQEGVFSDPSYMLREALQFVLEILDHTRVNPQKEPDDLLDTLTSVLKQSKVRGINDILSRMLQSAEICKDQYALYRLYRVASYVFEPTQIRERLLRYQSHSPELMVKLRLDWSYRWEIDMREASRSLSFWEGVPSHLWAEYLWRTAFNNDKVTNLLAPSGLHQNLVVQFTANPIATSERSNRKIFVTKSLSNWAIWKLRDYQQIVYYIIARSPKVIAENIELPSLENTDFVGLNEAITIVMKDMLEIYHNMVINISPNKTNEVVSVLEKFISKIIEYLKQPGLVSWIAYQVGKNILKLAIVSIIYESETRINTYYSSYIFDEVIHKNVNLLNLYKELQVFHIGSINSRTVDGEDSVLKDSTNFLLNELEPVVYRRLPEFPRYIRTEVNGQLHPIVTLLENHILNQADLPFDWIKSLPLTTEIIKALIEKCIKCKPEFLPNLLESLNDLRFCYWGIGKPLSIQDMNRVLKIARTTNDPKILNGVSVTISTSKFIKSAGSDLILKLLTNTGERNNLASIVFSWQSRNRDDVDDKTLSIIDEVANSILKSPNYYSFRVVCGAANYIAEREPISLPPILLEEGNLGLQVREL